MKFLLNIAPVLMLSGCASIINGKWDEVEVRTDPPGARVLVVGKQTTVNSHVSGNDITTEVPQNVAFTTKTPAKLTLSKKDLWMLYIEKKGYQTEVITVFKRSDPDIWWNALNIFIFLPVDIATGAAHCAQQTQYNIKLDPK